MVYDRPFLKHNFTKHLVREHGPQWQKYKTADSSGKMALLAEGKPLPLGVKDERIQKRLFIMKKTRAGMSKGKSMKSTAVSNGTRVASWHPDQTSIRRARDLAVPFSWTLDVKRLWEGCHDCSVEKKVADIVTVGVLGDTGLSGRSGEAMGFTNAVDSVDDIPDLDSVSWLSYCKLNVAHVVLYYLANGVEANCIANLLSGLCGLLNIPAREVQKYVVASSNMVTAWVLKRLCFRLKQKGMWALALQTRRCRTVNKALEVFLLIGHAGDGHSRHYLHLLSLRKTVAAGSAGRALCQLLDCICAEWRQQLVTWFTGVNANNEAVKDIEEEVMNAVREAISPLKLDVIPVQTKLMDPPPLSEGAGSVGPNTSVGTSSDSASASNCFVIDWHAERMLWARTLVNMIQGSWFAQT